MPENNLRTLTSILLLQKLCKALLTVVGHAGGCVDHDALFDGRLNQGKYR